MTSRGECLERLSERLTEQQLRKVMTQGYTDVSLSVMAEYNKEYARMLANCKYSPQTFNKLTEAYSQKRMSEESYLMIMDHAQYTDRNEPYADAFLDSLNTIYPSTAANCFAAVNYNDMSYERAISFVQSGAFYTTDQASLSVTPEVAAELFEMRIPLRGCEGFNNCYDVDDLQASLDDGDAIFVRDADMSLAVVIHDLMKRPEWTEFRDSVISEFGDMTANLTGQNIRELWEKHEIKKLHAELQDKIRKEHCDFLSNLRERSPDDIIRSAYMIVTTDQISMYMRLYEPPLSAKEYKALLSSENTLMEIYEEWNSHDDWTDMENMGYAMEKAAESIQYSIDRKEDKIAEKMTASHSQKEPEQKQKHYPKR